MPINIELIKKRISESNATNRNHLYDSHIYWSQKPFNIANILIESFSESGDTVFDPFLGSGVTLLESIKNDLKRNAIGCELNEAPLYIVKTLLREYNLKDYQKEVKLLVSELDTIDKYYVTSCEICSKEAKITSTIFDKPLKGDLLLKTENYYCPKCKKRYNRDVVGKVITGSQKHIPRNFSDLKLIPNTKIAVYEDYYISDIFTKRNFMVIDEILGIINEKQHKEVFKYLLMSILHLSKITDKHSNSQWPLWVPKKDCVEKNVVDLFRKKIASFEKTIVYINSNYNKRGNYKLLHKGSQHITNEDIQPNTVDLIITDPPYLGQVAYSEYMQLYKPFLNLDFNLEDEIIVSSNKERPKQIDEYFSLLDKVFEISSNKLKDNKYLCMYFHDSNLQVWVKLLESLEKHHFRYISQVHIKKTNTLKNILSPKKSLNGDAVLFFIKDANHVKQDESVEEIDEIIANVVKHIKQAIREKGSLSTPELYDGGLMEYLIYNNWLKPLTREYDSLVEIFEKYLYWDENISKWVEKKISQT